MAMNGIGGFDRIAQLNYGRIGENNLQQDTVALQQEAVQEPKKEVSLSLNLDGIRARQNMSISDLSLSMRTSGNSNFEMKAMSFKPDNDDVNKAFSDMQKDSSLMQYSYFVGDSNVVLNDEDGVVIRK